MQNKPIFFDTVVLSNFSFVDSGLLFLRKKYSERGGITMQVETEVIKASYSGIPYVDQIEEILLVKKGFKRVRLTEEEYSLYITLLRNLGDGEASCIAAAKRREGVVATDDRLARNYCKEQGLPVTGTIGILKNAVLEGLLGMDEADDMLRIMIENGFYVMDPIF